MRPREYIQNIYLFSLGRNTACATVVFSSPFPYLFNMWEGKKTWNVSVCPLVKVLLMALIHNSLNSMERFLLTAEAFGLGWFPAHLSFWSASPLKPLRAVQIVVIIESARTPHLRSPLGLRRLCPEELMEIRTCQMMPKLPCYLCLNNFSNKHKG